MADPDLELHLAIGIYLASYFDNNVSSKAYYEAHKDE